MKKKVLFTVVLLLFSLVALNAWALILPMSIETNGPKHKDAEIFVLNSDAGILDRFSLGEVTKNRFDISDYVAKKYGQKEYHFVGFFIPEMSLDTPYEFTIFRKGIKLALHRIWNAHHSSKGYAYQHEGATPVAPVPEPTTMLLFGAGLAGLAVVRKKGGKKGIE